MLISPIDKNTILSIQLGEYDDKETIDFLLDEIENEQSIVESQEEEIDDLRTTIDVSKNSLDELINEFENTLNNLCSDIENGEKYTSEEIKYLFQNVNTFYAETYCKLEG